MEDGANKDPVKLPLYEDRLGSLKHKRLTYWKIIGISSMLANFLLKGWPDVDEVDYLGTESNNSLNLVELLEFL